MPRPFEDNPPMNKTEAVLAVVFIGGAGVWREVLDYLPTMDANRQCLLTYIAAFGLGLFAAAASRRK